MALRDSWHNMLVWFALAEERDPYGDAYDDDEPEHDDRRERAREPVREPTPVRRIDRARRRREDFDDIFSDEDAGSSRSGGSHLRPVGGSSRPAANSGGPGGDVRVHLVLPKSFNDAQQIADRFKDGIPVVINLQTSDTDLSKRLIDFASGLTYAMDGGMQRIADKVFMLTPANVSISAEERAQLIEKGFFNQS